MGIDESISVTAFMRHYVPRLSLRQWARESQIKLNFLHLSYLWRKSDLDCQGAPSCAYLLSMMHRVIWVNYISG